MDSLTVAVSGTHGTGKSTLIRYLQSRFESDFQIDVVPEAAREIVRKLSDSEFFESNFSVERQLSTIGFQMLSERLALNIPQHPKKFRLTLCDRSLVDLWAYATMLFPAFAESSLGLLWREIIERWAKNVYDIIVFLPIEGPMNLQEQRYQGAKFQSTIDAAIRNLYREFGIEVVILRGSLDERLDKLISLLPYRKAPPPTSSAAP
jgi:predicted ATPase